MRQKRCHWYRDDGSPLERHSGAHGCQLIGRCTFAHPGEEGWGSALSVLAPPRAEDADAGHNMGRKIRGRSRSLSSRRRRHSSSRKRDHQRSASPARSPNTRTRRTDYKQDYVSPDRRYGRRRSNSRDSNSLRSRSHRRRQKDRFRSRMGTPRHRSPSSSSVHSRPGEYSASDRTRDPPDQAYHNREQSTSNYTAAAGPSTDVAVDTGDQRPQYVSASNRINAQDVKDNEHRIVKVSSTGGVQVTSSTPHEMDLTQSGNKTVISTGPRALTASLPLSQPVPPLIVAPTTFLSQTNTTTTITPSERATSFLVRPIEIGLAPCPAPPANSPPPIPTVPLPSNLADPTGLPSASGDNMIWPERIKLLSRATAARSSIGDMENELRRYNELIASNHFSRFPDEARAAVKKGFTNVTFWKMEKTKELQEATKRLTDLFPLCPQCCKQDFSIEAPTREPTPRQVETKPGVRIVTGELKDVVSQLHHAMQALNLHGKVSMPPLPHIKDAIQSDLLPPEYNITSREFTPSKGPGRTDAASHSDMEFESVNEERKDHPAPLAAIEGIHEYLLQLEDRISEMEDDSAQQEHDLMDEVDLRIEEKVNEMQESQEELRQDEEPVSVLETDVQLTRTLRDIENELETSGNQVTELAQEIADLIMREGVILSENAKLKKENEELRRQQVETEAKYKAELEAMRHDMQSIAASVKFYEQAHKDAPECHPMANMYQDSAVEHLLQSLWPSIHEDVRSLSQETYQNIKKLVQTETDDTRQAVLPKVATAVRVTETIKAWMEATSKGTYPLVPTR